MNTGAGDEITAYAAERRRLIYEFDAIPENRNLVAWQLQLAAAIMTAEQDAADRTKSKSEKYEAKRHRHLLRVIGDGLVHTLVPSHTTRTLSRHPGKPPHLTSQGEDLQFVFDVANSIASVGGTPILSDITTLIGVGDIIVVDQDGIAVIECKNRLPPIHPPRGRVARQQQRGEDAASYLVNSHIAENGGYRIAYENPLPEPDYELVQGLLKSCREAPNGTASHTFGPRDGLIAATEKASSDDVMSELSNIMGPQTEDESSNHLVGISFWDELVQSASYRRVAPPNYPIDAELRWLLLERELHLIRIADVQALAAEVTLDDGTSLRLTPRRGEHGFEVVIDGTEADLLVFSHEITELCAWSPVAVSALRESLIEQARLTPDHLAALTADDPSAASAYGDTVVYRTLYRPGDTSPVQDVNEVADEGSSDVPVDQPSDSSN